MKRDLQSMVFIDPNFLNQLHQQAAADALHIFIRQELCYIRMHPAGGVCAARTFFPKPRRDCRKLIGLPLETCLHPLILGMGEVSPFPVKIQIVQASLRSGQCFLVLADQGIQPRLSRMGRRRLFNFLEEVFQVFD